MSYTATHAARLKDMKSLATKIKGVTDDHELRLQNLETLAEAMLYVVNALITNIERND